MAKSNNRITPLRTVGTFLNGRACSNTLMCVLDRAFDHPSKSEEDASMPFAGGIMQHGYQCGMIWGATLAAGAQAYRLYGPGPEAEARAILAAQHLVESFRARNKTINCMEITDLDKSATTWQHVVYFLLKGGSVGCLRMAAGYAPAAFDEVNAAFSKPDIDVPEAPVSCAAMLARKMGVSDRYTAMVAGLAGGIGLCGGACGALGAAIWLIGIKSSSGKDGKVEFKAPEAKDTIDRFIKATDYRFECSNIVGRQFENTSDHADYLRGGGCSKILEVLAAV